MSPKKNIKAEKRPSIASFIRELKARTDIRDLTHHEVIKPRNPLYSKTKEPLSEETTSALTSLGIVKLYSHQALAIDLIREGKNTVVMTPTASGKSLIYNIPVLEDALIDTASRALYIFPLKGLEQDQLKGLREFISAMDTPLKPTAEIYDGDTSQHKRKKIRNNPPNILITNPDMLHLGICAFHEKWEEFFKDLKYVVIDELHSYRGVIGSHMAQLIRRLRRIASHYGAEPVFITSSATIANPQELSEEVTGLDFTLIKEDGAPASEKNFLFLDPPEGMSPYTLATKIFTSAVSQGLRTIAFTKSRKVTELMHRWVVEASPELEKKVSSYRAGYLPEERREIEGRLFSGELKGVISTSALELGIDIGGLDVCVLVGYPGTISSTWQRAGRVGRGSNPALIIMVSLEDALDKYFMHRPEEFFTKATEAATIDRENYPILKAHLPPAASEVPIKKDEELYIGIDALDSLLEELVVERKLWYSPT
ncbi:MAG: DEAD/DEAH box helicase, partial [Deltaproteobacteria bacterium]|nr:DEAD/DEAH box helicase [Deltaproteobacteria bacterium]